MQKTFYCLVLASAMGLLAFAVKAENYGPPANIPMGPSAEQLQKMQDGEAQALAGMKKNSNQFEKGVNIIKAQVAKLNKKGMATTPEMAQSIADLDKFLADLKAATDINAMQTLFDSFGDLIDKAQENLQIMSKQAKWPSVEKQATKQIADLDKQSAALKAKASQKKVADVLADNFTALDQVIASLKTDLAAMQSKVKTDPDAVFETDVSSFFDKVKDAYENNIRDISASMDLKKAVSQDLPKLVAGLDKRVQTLAKNKKINTVDLKNLVNQAKAKLNGLKTAIAGKISDLDGVVNSIDDLTNLASSFEDKWTALTGQDSNSYEPKIPADNAKDYQMPDLNNLMKQLPTK